MSYNLITLITFARERLFRDKYLISLSGRGTSFYIFNSIILSSFLFSSLRYRDVSGPVIIILYDSLLSLSEANLIINAFGSGDSSSIRSSYTILKFRRGTIIPINFVKNPVTSTVSKII